MTIAALSLKRLVFSFGASMVLMSPQASIAQNFNNIAFHPVPLTDASQVTEQGLLQVTYNRVAGEPFHTSSAEQFQAAIRQVENTSGPFSPAAAQQAESLGDFLASNGDPEGAVEAFEKSLHIHRVNEGLHSPAQANLLKKIIAGEIDAGNLDAAHGLQESLLYLSKKNHEVGDEDYVSAILEWADWNVDLLVMANNAPVNTAPGGDFASLNTQLITAQDNHIEAIELIRSQPASSPEYKKLLIHAEKKMAAINYIANSGSGLFAYSPDSDTFPAGSNRDSQAEMAYFFNGSNALKRAIAYSLEDPQPDYLSIAEQMMVLGDWHLLFDRRAAALTIYEDTFELLDVIQASGDDINRIMTPGMPVTAPDSSFTANSSTTDYHGYIDVEFRISKFGIPSKPEVIASSEQDNSPVTRALIRKIRQEKFRPAFIDGSATSGENVKLRYYYSYND